MTDPQTHTATGHNGRPSRSDEFGEPLSPSLRETLTAQEDHLRELIRAHPVAAVVGGLALGFVVARLLREL